MAELCSHQANEIASITLSLKMSASLTTCRTFCGGLRLSIPLRFVFYVKAGSGSHFNVTTPPLSWDAKSQRANFIINWYRRAAPGQQAAKQTVCLLSLFFIHILTLVPLGTQNCVWTVSWLCLHVCVSDYVKKTHCVWKTNWGTGRDDTSSSCWVFFFSLPNVLGLGGQSMFSLKSVLQQ